jgi:hypothetical protein
MDLLGWMSRLSELDMSFSKVTVFVMAVLTLAVIVLAAFSYVQLMEIRQMRDDMASLQRAVDTRGQEQSQELASLRSAVDAQGQDFSQELAALRTEVEELDISDELSEFMDWLMASQSIATLVDPDSMDMLSGLSWIEQEPDSVQTIRRSDYGSDWPFPTEEAQLGCHGGEVIVKVGPGEFMVDSSPTGMHGFLPDMKFAFVVDSSSAQMDRTRQRLTEEGRSLC